MVLLAIMILDFKINGDYLMNVMNIEGLNLNDSRILGVAISAGEICFTIDYIENYDSCASCVCLLAFKGCRSVKSSINLDVEWPDSILQAAETCEGEWRHVVLEMNTSASTFEISCRTIQLTRLDSVPRA